MGRQVVAPNTSRITRDPPKEDRVSILRTFHDDVGHWDLETTKRFVLDRYWWATVHPDISDYVRSCRGCQLATPIPKYRTTLHLPITSLFDVFSIDFAGPLPRSANGNRYVLAADEHLTGWPLASVMKNATARVVLDFTHDEIIHPFGPPRTIVSDNATYFKASTLQMFMEAKGICWKTVLAYAPMSNGRAERMVGTLKRAISKIVFAGQEEWESTLPRVLYGYCRRRMAQGAAPFELMYGVPPRMDGTEVGSLIPSSTEENRRMEHMATTTLRAVRSDRKPPKQETRGIRKFEVEGYVLVAKGTALSATLKWPSFSSKYFGQCKIVRARHPLYHIVSEHGRYSRTEIHARRLVRFHQRPEHLNE